MLITNAAKAADCEMPYRRVHRGGGLRISRFCTAQASLFEYLQKETVRGLAVDQSRVDDKAKGKAGTRAKQKIVIVRWF